MVKEVYMMVTMSKIKKSTCYYICCELQISFCVERERR